MHFIAAISRIKPTFLAFIPVPPHTGQGAWRQRHLRPPPDRPCTARRGSSPSSRTGSSRTSRDSWPRTRRYRVARRATCREPAEAVRRPSASSRATPGRPVAVPAEDRYSNLGDQNHESQPATDLLRELLGRQRQTGRRAYATRDPGRGRGDHEHLRGPTGLPEGATRDLGPADDDSTGRGRNARPSRVDRGVATRDASPGVCDGHRPGISDSGRAATTA